MNDLGLPPGEETPGGPPPGVDSDSPSHTSPLINAVIHYCLHNKMVVALGVLALLVAGLVVAPFTLGPASLPRSPVPVDAIPDIGENQQIVFADWMGRSPQDVEDQLTYPLTVALMGLPRVKTVRSLSMFGFGQVYVIFEDGMDFYEARTRILEKLSALPPDLLPAGVKPQLGPDATGLGQIFWYTLEGRDPQGRPTGGWDLGELRSVQDWYVRYGLLSVPGVAEVSSVGGFVQEYQVDVDPAALATQDVDLMQVARAVQESNLDVGARSLEINGVEYFVRGRGFIKSLTDLEESVVVARGGTAIRIKDVATVTLGPALRRGVLDKGGAEAVGGIVVTRHGSNPMEVIGHVKAKVQEISPGLPRKVLADGTVSQLTLVPFYDRTGLIKETLGTLESNLRQQVIVTMIVVIAMVWHLQTSLLICATLPLAVLFAFILMRLTGIDANIVALSGIAIAIGTLTDVGIVLTENMIQHLKRADPDEPRLTVLYRASAEVGTAILTAVLTTIVSFLPVFALEGAEGKLFRPLAFTKTYALLGSLVVALTVLPPLAHLLFEDKRDLRVLRRLGALVLLGAGGWIVGTYHVLLGLTVMLVAVPGVFGPWLPPRWQAGLPHGVNVGVLLLVTVALGLDWLPLGAQEGEVSNILLTLAVVGGLLGAFHMFEKTYARTLSWCMANHGLFLSINVALVLVGLLSWLGAEPFVSRLPASLAESRPLKALQHTFPGLQREFMPTLDEGAYLYMPTVSPHVSIGEATDILARLDKALAQVPEVDMVVGKAGRAESALDPAPISMYEILINYKPEYIVDEDGHPQTFARDDEGEFLRDAAGGLIPDPHGRPFRQWRPEIHRPRDIWNALAAAAALPGVTSASELQPIANRIVMLQTGMRASMGVKIKGTDLQTLDQVAVAMERILKEVPQIEPATVVAERMAGSPYLEVEFDRVQLGRFGITMMQAQDVLEIALGGRPLTFTVEGRARYPVRVRWARERRDSIEEISKIPVMGAEGVRVTLGEVARIHLTEGPQMIRSEDTFLTNYVTFGAQEGMGEVDTVHIARARVEREIKEGRLTLPPGVSYHFAGTWENEQRAAQRLSVIIPASLLIIFLLIYTDFRRVSTTLMVFSGIAVAASGGVLMLWLYGQPWFMDFGLGGRDLREVFQMGEVRLSVAVWVGFIALWGIACDDGVIIATYLNQSFHALRPRTRSAVRDAVVMAGLRRIKPTLMTTVTTILAMLPVLTSTGRGSDLMVPMAIPVFGGMVVELLTLFVVPVLYGLVEEIKVRRRLIDDA